MFDRDFRKQRLRLLRSATPRPRGKPLEDWAGAIGRDFPDALGFVERSPSPDGPLALGAA